MLVFLALYRVGQNMAPFIVHLITSPNINRFSKFFHVKIRRQFVMKLSLQIPSHLKCVAALPREMSDDALKPATPLTGCVINVDRAWHVALKQPRLKSSWLCCSGCPSTDGLSILTIHDSQPAKESHCHWVGQSAAAFGWSRHWSLASPASMRRPAARRTYWTFDVKTVRCDFLDNNWDNNTLFLLLTFFKCVVTNVVLFIIVIFKTLTFIKVA